MVITEVRFDLGPKVKVKLNIVSLQSLVASYLSWTGIQDVFISDLFPYAKNPMFMVHLTFFQRSSEILPVLD